LQNSKLEEYDLQLVFIAKLYEQSHINIRRILEWHVIVLSYSIGTIAVFTLAKIIGNYITNITYIFSYFPYLGHTPQIEIIKLMLCHLPAI